MANDPTKLVATTYFSMIAPGFDAISLNEAIFVTEKLVESKALNILEVGCATGFSTVLITKFSHEYLNDSSSIHSIDLLSHYYGMPNKKVGFLCDEHLSEEEKELLSIHHPHTSFDIPNIIPNTKFEFVFIDGSHEHPWATLDMIAILPHLSPEAIVVHHDLNLYKRKRCMYQLGPKYIFDQFDNSEKETIDELDPNIFSLHLKENYTHYAQQLINSLSIPWSMQSRPPAKIMFQIGHYIQKYWSDTELYHWYCFSMERYY